MLAHAAISRCICDDDDNDDDEWWWIVFVVWLTDERRLALFPAGTIVRDPHYRACPTLRAGFESAQNLSLGLFEWSYAVVITTTPRRHCSNQMKI